MYLTKRLRSFFSNWVLMYMSEVLIMYSVKINSKTENRNFAIPNKRIKRGFKRP